MDWNRKKFNLMLLSSKLDIIIDFSFYVYLKDNYNLGWFIIETRFKVKKLVDIMQRYWGI